MAMPINSVRVAGSRAPDRLAGRLIVVPASVAAKAGAAYPDVALEMISSRTFDRRIQLLESVPTILAGPGTNRVNA
jgi:hypothetical protein